MDQGTTTDVEDLRKFIEQSKIPGVALAVVSSTSIHLLHGFGTTSLENGHPVHPSTTLHPICSLSKAFTVLLLSMQADKGRFDWDAPLQTYIPDFNLRDPTISALVSAADFASHRTGLSIHDPLWYGVSMPPATVVALCPEMSLNESAFRNSFAYNNNAYKVLARLVEILYDAPFVEVVREHIFEPLGMSNTTFESHRLWTEGMRPHESKQSARKAGYTVMEFYSEGQHAAVGDTGICTPVRDYARWMQFILKKGVVPGSDNVRLISETGFARMFTPRSVDIDEGLLAKPTERAGPLAYALGWWVGAFRDRVSYTHTGWNDGFVSEVKVLPGADLAAVVFANVDFNPYTTGILHAALDLGLKWSGAEDGKVKSPLEWVKRFEMKMRGWMNAPAGAVEEVIVESAPYQLQKYVGEYKHGLYGILRIELGEGLMLMGSRGNLGASKLELRKDGSFSMKRGRWVDKLMFQFYGGEALSVKIKFEEWTEVDAVEFEKL
ncbi:beta-lactamase/transpeptidase-like protein [Cladochytrium replicatum]|nr:beta-lactamase/transpeptidase-like protein [Cladochytrium replicatum]